MLVSISSMLDISIFRSSHPEVFCKKGVLKNFTKFKGNHVCQRLFFRVSDLRPATFLKKETLAQMFSCEFYEISKNTFFHRTPVVAASAYCKHISNLSQEINLSIPEPDDENALAYKSKILVPGEFVLLYYTDIYLLNHLFIIMLGCEPSYK